MASRYPFPATPDGWYAVARSEDIAVGETRTLQYFGRELAASRQPHRGPELAGLAACEANGFVYAWHHARGAGPSYAVAHLRDEQSSWTPWRTSVHVVRVHVQDMTENILDRAHFTSVHDMAPPAREHFDVRFEGPSLAVTAYQKTT